jgi:PAS domain S-box-containing protein
MEKGRRLLKALRVIAVVLVGIVGIGAFFIFISWAFKPEIITKQIIHDILVNPFTAIGFVLTSLTYMLLLVARQSRINTRAGVFTALLVLILALLRISDHLFNVDLNFDLILFSDRIKVFEDGILISHMAPMAACNFIFSIALIFMYRWPSKKWIVHNYLPVLIIMIPSVSFINRLYRVSELGFFPMSLFTATCFILLGCSLMMIRPNGGLLRQLIRPYAGSRAGIILLPLSILIPIAVGYLRIWTVWKRVVTPELGAAIIVLIIALVFLVAVWRVVISLNKRDVKQKRSDELLLWMNSRLVNANKELADLNDQLRLTNKDLISKNEELNLLNEQLGEATETIARQKDERLNRVLDSSNDVIWSFDLTGNNDNYISHSAERIYGEPLENLLKRPKFYIENLHPDDKHIKEASQRRLELIGVTECTYRIKQGSSNRWIHDRLKLIYDEHRVPVRLEGIATDVTEIKNAELQIETEKQLLRSIIDNIPDAIFVKDIHLRTVIANNAAQELLGVVNEKEILEKNSVDYFGRGGLHWIEEEHTVFQSGEPTINHERTLSINHHEATLSTSVIPLKDDAGKVISIVEISRNITGLRNQEKVLNEYRKNLEILFTNTTDHFLLTDASWKVVLFNKTFENFIDQVGGIKAKEGMHFLDIVAPYRRAAAEELFKRALLGESITVEAEFSSPSGKIFQLLRYEPVITNGKVTHVSTSAIDITDRIVKESQLRKSEVNMRSVLTVSEDGFAIIDNDLNVVMVNDSYVRMVRDGQGKEPMVGYPLCDFVSEDQFVALKKVIDRVRENETVKYELVVNNENNVRWYKVTVAPLNTAENELLGFCIYRHDITPFKESELAIRANETRYRALIENSLEVSLISDFDGEIFFISDNLANILGYPSLQNYRELFHPDEMQIAKDRLAYVKANPGKPITTTFRVKHADGSWRWMEGTSTNLSHIESIQGIVSTYRDISVRKNIEEQLIRNQFFLEKASEAANIGYWTSEPDMINGKLTWSKEVFSIFQMNEEEFDGRNETFFSLIHPDDRLKVAELARIAMEKDQLYNIDHRVILKNGKVRWVNERAQILRNEKNEVSMMVGIVQDINDRKIIEEVLREYNDRYEILSKATNDVIWDFDIVNNLISYNHGIKSVFGYNDLDINSNIAWWEEHIHEHDRQRIIDEINKSIKKQDRTWEFFYRFRDVAGNYRHIHDRGYIVYSKEGHAKRMIGTMQDITNQTVYLEEIKKLSLVASKTDNSVVITDAQWKIEWVNDGFVRLHGYELGEVRSLNLFKFMEEANPESNIFSRLLDKLIRFESAAEELIFSTKSGDKFWARLSITPVLDENKELEHYVAIISDITSQKEYEKSITAIANELAGLIENANVPIMSIGVDRTVLDWNRVCTNLFGYSREEILGTRLFEEMLSRKDQKRFDKMIEQVLQGEPVGNFEMPIISRNKNRINLLMSASSGKVGDSGPESVIIVSQDITELNEYKLGLEKKVEERTRDLNQALQKEKELVEMKSRFVSIASHEFRTPLTSISMASGFIRKYKKRLESDEIDKKLDNIEKQVRHMAYLLDDVLMIGKSEAGKIQVKWSELPIKNLFENLAVEVMNSTRRTHRINLNLECYQKSFLSDEGLMRNIVINLLNNAVKFSPKAKEVDFAVSCQQGEMVIIVRDYGIGIPEEDIGKLFEAFYRGKNVTTISGSGLGLSIVKKATELLGGEVKLKSKIGIGTEITVTLPLKDEKENIIG